MSARPLKATQTKYTPMKTSTDQNKIEAPGQDAPLSEKIEWAKTHYGKQDVDWMIIYDDRGAGCICRDPNHPTLRAAKAGTAPRELTTAESKEADYQAMRRAQDRAEGHRPKRVYGHHD